MREGYVKGLLVAVTVVGMALPLFAEQGQENEKPRRDIRAGAARVMPGLTEEGREIIDAHRQQQREKMQERGKARREEHKAVREALAAEEDPQKQLDIIEATIKARSAGIKEEMEAAQQARLTVYGQALAASGVEDAEREKIIEKMLSNQAKRKDSAGSKGDTVLEEIAKLRQKSDLTKEDVRRVAGMMHGGGRARQEREARGEGAERPQPRGRKHADMQEKPQE